MEIYQRLLKENKITKMELLICLDLQDRAYKTIRQICFIYGFDYSHTTKAIKKLIELDLIDKTKESPAKYFIK